MAQPESYNKMQIVALVNPLATQLPANVSRKAAKDGPHTRGPCGKPGWRTQSGSPL